MQGKLELEEQEFDLQRMLESLQNTLGLQIEQKHGGRVQLDFRLDPDVPQMVRGDSTRILQIIYNLLSNALKFTTQGTIQLRATVEQCSQKQQQKKQQQKPQQNGEYVANLELPLAACEDSYHQSFFQHCPWRPNPVCFPCPCWITLKMVNRQHKCQKLLC